MGWLETASIMVPLIRPERASMSAPRGPSAVWENPACMSNNNMIVANSFICLIFSVVFKTIIRQKDLKKV